MFLKKGLLFYLTILFVFNTSQEAQTISIKINGKKIKNIELYSLSGEKLTFIDSLKSSQNNFTFHINDERGLYRIVFDKNKYLNFVYDGEDIELTANLNAIIDSLKVLKSESNKIYYEFLKLNKDYKTKSELLQLILTRYPKDDDFYIIAKNKLKQLQEEYNYFVNVTSKGNQNSFISKYIQSAQLPIID